MKPLRRKRKYRGVRLGIAALVAASLAFGQSRTLPPQDEAGRDPVFAAFFTQFREVVRTRDTPALLRMISPTIQNSFGPDDGAAEFRRIWEIEKPDSKVWGVLDRLLRLGGSWFDLETYCAPYVAVRFPADLDAFEHLVVAGTGVRLRAAASYDATVRARLSYEIVRVVEWPVEHNDAWTQVRTLAGVTGFVATEYLYSPVGYRTCFGKSATGSWQMKLLVAGD